MSHAFRRLSRTLCHFRKMLPSFLKWKMRLENPLVRIVMLIFVIIVLFFVGHVFFGQNDYAVRSHIFCFNKKGESLATINLDPPVPDRSIFFIDTYCISHLKNRIYLPARQVCAVEAAARLHPHWNIYVLFGSPGVLKYDGKSKKERVMKVLLNYDNIKLHRIEYDRFLNDTPLEKFAKAKIPFDSPNSHWQANDILRIAALWRYGGVALDLNMLLLKNIENLNKYFLGADHDRYGNDVMRISSKYKIVVLPIIIKKMYLNYIPNMWNSLGSSALTRAIQSDCPSFGQELVTECGFLKIYPKRTFYPTKMMDWSAFFQHGNFSILNVIKDSYAMRTWNIHVATNVTDEMAFGAIARRVCPKAYAVSRGMFG